MKYTLDCGEISIRHNDEYSEDGMKINLTSFFEIQHNIKTSPHTGVKPLLDGHVIEIKNKKDVIKTFRTERYLWNINDQEVHCYVFVDITLSGKRQKAFAKTPSHVHQSIQEKKITITNKTHPTWK